MGRRWLAAFHIQLPSQDESMATARFNSQNSCQRWAGMSGLLAPLASGDISHSSTQSKALISPTTRPQSVDHSVPLKRLCAR